MRFFERHPAWVRKSHHSKELVLLIQKHLKLCLVPTKNFEKKIFTFFEIPKISKKIEYFFIATSYESYDSYHLQSFKHDKNSFSGFSHPKQSLE